jgi:hypothetical protein
MFGDRNEQEIEEIPLRFGCFAPGEKEVKIFGETHAPHEIAAKVQPAHFDTIRIGLADVAFCSAFTNLHGSPWAEYNRPHDIRAPAFGKARCSSPGMGHQPCLNAALRFA